MWVFDGEEWTEDNGNEHSGPKPEVQRPRYDQFVPELQVVEVEIVHVPRHRDVPPLPMP